ncbi:MAG: hypothetical protein ABJH63_10005 [Rhizobiaceae bacterium]
MKSNQPVDYCEQIAKFFRWTSENGDSVRQLGAELISINGLFTMIVESGAKGPVVKTGLELWQMRRY